MNQTQLFEAALGIKAPWYVQGVDFNAARRELTIAVDFVAGTRFPYPGVAGEHPAHDTQIKRLRHLNFFQHRSEEHTSELQSHLNLVCRLLLEKKKKNIVIRVYDTLERT